MPAKKVTIESLARMVASGFNSIETKMATKLQVEALDKRLTRVEEKLDNIEKMLIRQQNEKIQNLERRVHRLEEMFAVK